MINLLTFSSDFSLDITVPQEQMKCIYSCVRVFLERQLGGDVGLVILYVWDIIYISKYIHMILHIYIYKLKYKMY